MMEEHLTENDQARQALQDIYHVDGPRFVDHYGPRQQEKLELIFARIDRFAEPLRTAALRSVAAMLAVLDAAFITSGEAEERRDGKS